MADVKITVAAKLRPGKIFDELAAGNVNPDCDAVKLGAEYISKSLKMPEGFCSWAWADIQRDVAHLALGGDFRWINKPGSMVSCCTDGLRPVVFKLERIEE
ncbi:TIGR04076 family protein [Candidatus Bathyarchaeota archaeon]|nr:TIGR04076 family protein [Candidatus Bathyarchaeota archaeon]